MAGTITAGALPSSGFSTRNLFAVMVVCFLAPTVWVNTWLGFTFLVDLLMGFTPDQVTYWSVRGCFMERWMNIVSFFTNELFILMCILSGFWLSRKGHKVQSTGWLLAGAVGLYPIADRLVWRLMRRSNPLWFMDRKAVFEKMQLPLFGDFYTFRWVSFLIDTGLSVGLLFVAYQVVFLYWDKPFRLTVFTAGALAGGLGWLFWFFWLGPIVY